MSCQTLPARRDSCWGRWKHVLLGRCLARPSLQGEILAGEGGSTCSLDDVLPDPPCKERFLLGKVEARVTWTMSCQTLPARRDSCWGRWKHVFLGRCLARPSLQGEILAGEGGSTCYLDDVLPDPPCKERFLAGVTGHSNHGHLCFL